MAEYERTLSDNLAAGDFKQRNTVLAWLHLDGWLLLLLLLLMAYGLFVLYSASDGSQATLLRQLRNYGIALAALLMASQIRLETYLRWSPVFYLGSLLSQVFLSHYTLLKWDLMCQYFTLQCTIPCCTLAFIIK